MGVGPERLSAAGHRGGEAPPNPRVQRTRSSPSALHAPLTRHPLGGGYRQSVFLSWLIRRSNLLELPAHPIGWVADMDIAFARTTVQAWHHGLAGLLRCNSVRDRHHQPAPSGGTPVAVTAIHSRSGRYCLLQLPRFRHARVVAVLLCISAQRSVDATQHRITSLLRSRVLGHRHRHVAPAW